jgi:hypothetical protein
VRRELILVASRKRRHLDSLRIHLVIKEHVEIPVFDTPETHRECHVVDPGHVQSLLVSVLASTTVSERGGARDRLLPPGTHHLDEPNYFIDHRQCGFR